MKTKYVLGIVIGLIIIASLGLVVVNNYLLTDSQQAEEPLTIGLLVYPGFAPFFIAEEKGFFEKQGVDAELIVTSDPMQGVAVLASGNAQILFNSADIATVVVDSGVDIKEIFASDIGYGADGLLVKDDINSIQDLKGKTVYAALGTPSHFLLRVLAREAGMQREDITLVHMEADQVGAAFVAGQIDYGMSWEPWLSKASEREDGKVLLSSRDKPGIVTDTFIVRTDTLESRRDDVKAVVRAWFDAIEFWEEHPDEANAIMAKNLGLPVDEFEAQVATVKFLDYHENLIKFDRSSELNMYELTEYAVEIFREDGIIKSDVDPDALVDASILKDLYK